MAYDADLADRVRELLVDGSPVTEQKSRSPLPKKWHIERIDTVPTTPEQYDDVAALAVLIAEWRKRPN